MDHSILAPSGMSRTVKCPGWIYMSQGLPSEQDTPESMEGTAVHWLASQGNAIPTADHICPNGVVATQEMINAAVDYLAVIPDDAVIEQPVSISRIHEQMWGTPDARRYVPTLSSLDVYDLKYGHKPVDAFGNWQLICYTVGILDQVTDGNALHADSNIVVNMHVYQPRRYDGKGPLLTWTVPAVDLRGYVNILTASCNEAMSDNPTIAAGNHCYECPARFRCPANQQAIDLFADYAQSALPVDPVPAALARELKVLRHAQDMLDQRSKAIEAQAEHLITSGGILPGYALKNTYGRNAWTGSDKEVKSLGQLMGVDLLSDPKPVTPAEAGRRIKAKGLDPDILKPMYSKRMTGHKLVEDATNPFQQEK